MDQTFFLAANSGQGFASCYDDFPGGGMFLHIIKGGPGTGKSSFMRCIRDEAAARGFDTETILCSGDPDSLDAVSIPALGLAWVDGTAPHVREPVLFGADSDYVNLGQFCRTPLSGPEQERAAALNAAYKACYREAYALLPCCTRPSRRRTKRSPRCRVRAEGFADAISPRSPAGESCGLPRQLKNYVNKIMSFATPPPSRPLRSRPLRRAWM